MLVVDPVILCTVARIFNDGRVVAAAAATAMHTGYVIDRGRAPAGASVRGHGGVQFVG